MKDLSQPADTQQPTVTATQIIHQKYSLTNQFQNPKRISKIPISWIKYTDGSGWTVEHTELTNNAIKFEPIISMIVSKQC